jgi:hypothetical protein
MYVKSKFLRHLIVDSGYVLAIVLVPLAFVWTFVTVTYWKVVEAFDVTYLEGFAWMLDGMKDTIKCNKEFIKTGDLTLYSQDI